MKNSTIDKLFKTVPYLLSLITILLIWWIFAQKVDSVLIIPRPEDVLIQIFDFLLSSVFWSNILFTFLRVLYSFLITIVSGFLIGIFCSKNSFVKDFFKIPLAVIRVTPVISVILIVMFWLKSSTVPVAVTVLMCLPVMITSIINGGDKKNTELLNVAKVFDYTGFQKFIFIELPELKPFFWSGAVSVFGMCWKVVVAGEVLSLPGKGVGVLIQKSQLHLETTSVMAYTILLVAFSFILELLFTELCRRISNE